MYYVSVISLLVQHALKLLLFLLSSPTKSVLEKETNNMIFPNFQKSHKNIFVISNFKQMTIFFSR